MKDSNEEYFEIVKAVGGGLIIIALVIWFLLCSGCKILKSQKVSTKDSVSVDSSKQGSVRVDSSGTKTDKVNTKETVYYPQPIIVPGKDGETKVVFVPQTVKEVGTERTEQAQIIKDTSWKEAFNSLAVLIANKETEKKVKAGPSFIEWILIAGLALLLLKNFLPFKIIKS